MIIKAKLASATRSEEVDVGEEVGPKFFIS